MSGHIRDRWTKADPDNPKKRIRTPRYGNGKRWVAAWVEGDGTRRNKAFDYKDEAKAFIESRNNDKRIDDFVTYESGAVTIRDLAPKWLDSKRRLRDGTLAEYQDRLAKHILPTWGDWPVRDIRTEQVESWISSINLGASSVRKIHSTLAGILDYAVKTKRVSKNHARGIELPEEPQAEQRFLTHDEVNKLVNAMPAHWHDYTSFLADTGLRMGEGVELRVKDFIPTRKRIKVSRSAGRVKGEWVVGPTKNGQPREVPLTASCMKILRTHSKGKGREELIFTSPRGTQIERTNYRRMFVAAAGKVELLPLTPHDLRHTAASWAISAGASPRLVQMMLGHKSAAITLDIYGGLFEKDIDSVVRLMERLSRRASTERPEGGLSA